jgi:hypothetical protein
MGSPNLFYIVLKLRKNAEGKCIGIPKEMAGSARLPK